MFHDATAALAAPYAPAPIVYRITSNRSG